MVEAGGWSRDVMGRSLIGLGIAVPLLLATAARSPGQGNPGIPETLEAQLAERGAKPWVPGRLLTWSEFAAEPARDNESAARLTSGVFYASECRAGVFTFGVSAGFVPGQSWVQRNIVSNRTQSAATLAHEQGHFDLSELQARLLRRALSEAANPCAGLKTTVAAMVDSFLKEERALQARYDRETGHGIDVTRQLAWEAYVKARLDSLSAHAEPVVTRPREGRAGRPPR